MSKWQQLLTRRTRVKPKSDGCTLWFEGGWHHCCVEHDAHYYEGGSEAARKAVDVKLLQCVIAAGHPYMAIIMFLGVRIFGNSFWPTRMRWGRKYPYFRRRLK